MAFVDRALSEGRRGLLPPRRTLRIAYILTPITFGGAEKVSLNFLGNTTRDRYDVRPVLLTRPWEEETHFACELRRYGYSYETVPVAMTRGFDPFRVPRVSRMIYDILHRGSFDLVHTNGYFADICGLPVARLLRIKTIATCHGYIATNRRLRCYNRVDRLSLRVCHRIFAVSERIKAELTRAGIAETRIHVLQNSVSVPTDPEVPRRHRGEKRRMLAIGSHEFVVGFAGRLSEEKGLTVLLQAIALMRQRGTDCKVVIVGDGPERDRLERLVEAERLGQQVLFTGFQPRIEEWIPAFDLFVLPSLTEGTPVALLEAMSLGVPVVASAVGGVPAIVKDGENGFLVAPGNPTAIVERLEVLRGDGSLRGEFSRKGLRTVRSKFDLSEWCRNIEQCYESLMKQRPGEQ